MRNYNKIIASVLLVSTTLFSCNNNEDQHITAPSKSTVTESNTTSSDTEIKKDNNAVIGSNISASEFKATIFDYSANEQWVYKYNKACIIDFYADWCRPCKIMDPVLHSAVESAGGNVDLFKVNVDKEKELAGAFHIQSIPTLLFCPADGSQPFVLQGITSKEDLTKAIAKITTPTAKI